MYNGTDEYHCVQCRSAFYPNSDSTQCQTCLAGSACVNGSTALCSSGSYQDAAGQTACMACMAGRYAGVAGVTACTACNSTSYVSLTGQTACVGMLTGYYGTLNADGSGYNAEVVCPAGAFCVGGTAQLCSPGTYQTGLGATGCVACGAGRYSAAAGTLHGRGGVQHGPRVCGRGPGRVWGGPVPGAGAAVGMRGVCGRHVQQCHGAGHGVRCGVAGLLSGEQRRQCIQQRGRQWHQCWKHGPGDVQCGAVVCGRDGAGLWCRAVPAAAGPVGVCCMRAAVRAGTDVDAGL